MTSYIVFIVGFILGIVFTRLCTKKDGRIVIGKDDYFVGISTKPEEIVKHKTITLRVIKKE